VRTLSQSSIKDKNEKHVQRCLCNYDFVFDPICWYLSDKIKEGKLETKTVLVGMEVSSVEKESKSVKVRSRFDDKSNQCADRFFCDFLKTNYSSVFVAWL